MWATVTTWSTSDTRADCVLRHVDPSQGPGCHPKDLLQVVSLVLTFKSSWFFGSAPQGDAKTRKETTMANSSYSSQPGNPDAYDYHEYRGGTGGPNAHGTPHGHGHQHIQNGQLIYDRPPVEEALGSLAVNGNMPPTYNA